jgi:ubiquinone/menaquinone biosynthesis C-methylase UbiE
MDKFNYYDSIASIYDQTRWMTESVADDVADYILALVNATPETSFLEPGVGTGLNVFPLIKRGYCVTGIDVSKEMLDQFRQKFKTQKFKTMPHNLTLLQADASKLPFSNQRFDVVLTVHMVHTVSDWQIFLDEIDRVLKPNGFYLNAQWITPPARMEFEGYFRTIVSKYEGSPASNSRDTTIDKINVEKYFQNKGYLSKYLIAKEWTVSNTVAELLSYFKSRAYGLCWRMSDETFHAVMDEFEAFCIQHYGSLKTELSSKAKFEIWSYTSL